MAGEENNIPHKEPTPLSMEGASIQMDVDVKPKPASRATVMSIKRPGDIKKIIATPKESGSGIQDEPFINDAKSASSSSDADTIAAARARMNSEPPPPPTNPTSLSSSAGGEYNDGEVINEEDGKFYAELLVEGFELLAVWVFTWWGKDADEDKYKPSQKSKTKLIYLLGKMLTRAGKKHPVELYFFATLILMYVPAFNAARENRKKVLAEKAAQALLNEESAAKKEAEGGGSGGRKRRSLKQDSEISDATLENE